MVFDVTDSSQKIISRFGYRNNTH